ncbi:MAG: methionine--tRNA ligase [Candidatus Nanoarchaeia archaeon]|nr:methionine--tRNA ligase [Candidatus Nanoarchaeia archaeon]
MKYNKVVVNSAWPYSYSIPHLGNLIGCFLPGDAFSRYYKLKGLNTIFVSGSDSHGTRIEYEAIKKGVSPKEIAYDTHEKIKELIKKFEIEFDNYTITDTKLHHEFAREFYTRLNKKGFIITKIEKQPYCNNCKMFLAEKFITGTCPYCKSTNTKGDQCDDCGKLLDASELIKPVCTICNKESIILKETKHWYIDLKKLEPEIKKYVQSHPEWDKRVKEYTNNFFKMGLKPRPITRDIKWGIPAPFQGAENKVFYVWVEAVLGYLSASEELLGKKYLDYWKAKDVKHIYCLGKDNVAFHSIILPALLMSDSKDWHLPDLISSIEFLNFEGQKFSKTKGVGIWMDEALKLLPEFYWRFYLLLNRPETHDFNFTWETLDEAINNVLINNVGNFLNRSITFASKYGMKKTVLNSEDKKMIKEIDKTSKTVDEFFENGSLRGALNAILELSSKANKFFQDRKPWADEKLRYNTINVSLQLSKALTIMLYPFIPSVSVKSAKMLGFEIKSLKQINEPIDIKYKIINPEILIQKIDIKEIKAKYEAMKTSETKTENYAKFEDFKKVKLIVGKILKVEELTDKLYKLTVKADKERIIVSGIRKYYTKEELLNKKIILIANLEPRKIMGVESQGMILAAEDKGKISLILPDRDVAEGSELS